MGDKPRGPSVWLILVRYGLGGLMVLGGIVMAASSSNSSPNSLDSQQVTGLVIALAGLVGDYAGIFKIAESYTSKFSAVQRYNAIVHGDDLAPMSRQGPLFQAQLLAFRF